MTTHKEVADRGDGQAASKTPCTRNDIKLAYKPPKTFIPINEDYALGADAHAWHILKRHRDKDNYRWEPTAKYATLEQCVNGFAERAVRLSGAQTLTELLAESQRVVSVICGALQPHFKVERRS